MDLINPPAPCDPLGHALDHLRMSGAFYCQAELTEPWGLTLMALPGYVWFHVVTAGSARVEVEGHHAATLAVGDVALVVHGAGHVLRSGPDATAPGVLEIERDEISDRYEVMRHGGGGSLTRMMCGAVSFDQPAARNLVAALPDLIRIEGRALPDAGGVESTLNHIAAEASRPRPGGEAVIVRLADVVVIQAIRAWIASEPITRTGWLAAMRDRQIGRALTLIHGDPARAWTVVALAQEVAMSRSAFAARFTMLAGEPAMQYVTRVRMQVAASTLRDEGGNVAELAARLGYSSPAAFARAFKRVLGHTPGAIKRTAGSPIATPFWASGLAGQAAAGSRRS